jgi:hypothetical protein
MTRKRTFIIVAVLIAVLLFPWKSTVAPNMSVRVFDVVGKPAGGVVVKQQWEYFSVGSQKYKEYSRTDENGYVAFPERSVRTNLLSKISSIILEISTAGHYGMGAHVMIWAYGSDPHIWGFVHYADGAPASLEITLERSDSMSYP